ncbi:hypothetical protein CRUP_010911, partial [Coryphaenoides rupestris]
MVTLSSVLKLSLHPLLVALVEEEEEEEETEEELKPLVPAYDPQTCQQIWNNGYSFLVEYDDTTDKSTLKGGPLEDQFRLCQFHFHWGESNAWGSEHTVDRKLFPAELHIVHWNTEKYDLFEEAVMEDNGLA